MLLGSIGIAVCIAVLIIVWLAAVRLGRVTESVFGKLDGALGVVRQEVVEAQERVTAAKVTTREIEMRLREVTKEEATRRLIRELNAVERTEQLKSSLERADQLLETSESIVSLAQELSSVVRSTGPSSDVSLLQELLEDIASVRAQCEKTTATVAKLHDLLAEASDDVSLKERIEQAFPFVARAVATLSSLDSRLEQLANRVPQAQTRLRDVKNRTQGWILAAAIIATLLIGWAAAGQAALCRLAWMGMWSRRREWIA